MSEFIDKCARAAVDAYNAGSGVSVPWEMLGGHAREVARNQVRAVLKAAREPSDEMTYAPRNAGATAGDYTMAGFEALAAWQAMIDQALEDA